MVNVPHVAAVVPTFFPDRGVAQRLGALLDQVDHVWVVDDGTVGDALDSVEQVASERLTVIRHEANRGIAAALNTGTSAALAAGADFVLTVDQDTALPMGYVSSCLAVFEQARAGDVRVGVVAAGSINSSPVLPHEFVAGVGLMRYAIQSGLVISSACLNECGLFDDRLVIDAVDTEFCLRVWQHGYAVAAASDTNITHELGTPMPATFFGIPRTRNGERRTYEYHAPFRQYYISRNGVDLAMRYWRIDRHWATTAITFNARDFAIGFAAGPHRFKHALAGTLGVVHGLRRRRGKLSDRWSRRLSTRRAASVPSAGAP